MYLNVHSYFVIIYFYINGFQFHIAFQKSHTKQPLSHPYSEIFVILWRDLTLNEHFMKMKMISIKKRRYNVKNRKKNFVWFVYVCETEERELAILYSYFFKVVHIISLYEILLYLKKKILYIFLCFCIF